MITLTPTDSLNAVLGGANSFDWTVETIDVSEGGIETHSNNSGNEADTTEFVVAAAPAAGKRLVKTIYVRNATAVTTTIQFKRVTGSTKRLIGAAFSLASGESLFYSDYTGWVLYNAAGTTKASV